MDDTAAAAAAVAECRLDFHIDRAKQLAVDNVVAAEEANQIADCTC